MKPRSPFAALPVLTAFSLLAAGCGGIEMPSLPSLPFMGEKNLERSRVPVNSTAYLCAGGKRFYLRMLESGASVWVILPEREFRLDRVAGEGGRYGNGKAVLTVGSEEVSLVDAPTLSFTGCRIPSAEPPKPEPSKAQAPATK